MINYSELGFSNNFMFGKIMENKERCKAFLEQIFICTFDPFGQDQCKYVFQNMMICEGKVLVLEDEAIKVFINTKGTKGIENEEFRELLQFIDSSEDRTYQNELVNELLKDLKKAQSNVEWRHEYMTWETLKEDCREEGRIQGRKEGLTQGREQEIISSVLEGDYGIERGAEKLRISVEELKQKIEQL